MSHDAVHDVAQGQASLNGIVGASGAEDVPAVEALSLNQDVHHGVNGGIARPAAPTPNAASGFRAADILVIGSANIDEVFSVPNIVRPGETIASTSFTRSIGGKGANEAIGASRAGASVKFVGSIGQDGADIKKYFESDGVQTDYLQISDLPTGRALIQVDPSGENSIIIQAGANYAPQLPLPDFSKAPLVLLQNEIPLERTIQVIKDAKRAGAIVVFNPSPLPSREQRGHIPWELVDWLIVNETEAPALGYHITQKPGGLVTTFGRRGAQLRVRADDEQVYRPAGQVGKSGVVDTTGAGDCFCSYFAALLLKLSDPLKPTAQERAELLTVANQAAAMSVEKKGAVYGVPLLYQVRERLTALGQAWPAWAE